MHGWAPFPREVPVTDPAAVRAALARILASERFQNCEADLATYLYGYRLKQRGPVADPVLHP
jgi:hypothetical protein